MKEFLISLLYPRHCPICHEVIRQPVLRNRKDAGKNTASRTGKEGGPLLICPECEKKVPYVKEPVCLRCGKPIAAKEMEYCYDCSRKNRRFLRGFALTVYNDTMRKSISFYKNRGRMEYADWYGEQIWEHYGQELMKTGAAALIPVPLHRSRMTERGFNQAQLLAEKLSRRMGIPVYSRALQRRKKTTAQKYLGMGARDRNLERVFAPGKQPVAGKIVILVDDIYTTGTTAQHCTEELLQAGALGVYLVNICIGTEED
jgi:ComF family protein